MVNKTSRTTQDKIIGGRLSIIQPKDGYRAAIDPVFLSASVNCRSGQSVLELGCGTGVVLSCICWRVPKLNLHGIEIQPYYVEIARQNAIGNGLDFHVWEGNIANLPKSVRQMSFDHVVMNPPYLQKGKGGASDNFGRKYSDIESIPLSLWIDTAVKRISPNGFLHLIIPPYRLQDVLNALPMIMGGVKIKPLRPRANQDANRLIIQAKKGGRARLRLLSDLILHKLDDHGFTVEAEDILRRGKPLQI